MASRVFLSNSRSDGVGRPFARTHRPQPMTASPNTTSIYVDADACPVKDEIYRVAITHGLPVAVVAGNFIRIPHDPLIQCAAAGPGMDAADDWIAARAGPGDIVVTADIPLASRRRQT